MIIILRTPTRKKWYSYINICCLLSVKVTVAQSCLTLCNSMNYTVMEFSRPEYWSGQPFPSPGDLPNPGIKPRSPALQLDSLPAEPQGKSRQQLQLQIATRLVEVGEEGKIKFLVCQVFILFFFMEIISFYNIIAGGTVFESGGSIKSLLFVSQSHWQVAQPFRNSKFH